MDRIPLALILAAACLWPSPRAAVAQSNEAQARVARIKAAIVLNFARYTTWPQDTFENEDSPLVMTVVGRPLVLPYLRAIVRDEQVDGRSIVVRGIDPPPPDDADSVAAFTAVLRASHLVYLPQQHEHVSGLLLEALSGADVLTVGDGRGFAAAGGMFELRRRRDRVTFAANVPAIEATRVRVSSKVLRLAEPVKEEP